MYFIIHTRSYNIGDSSSKYQHQRLYRPNWSGFIHSISNLICVHHCDYNVWLHCVAACCQINTTGLHQAFFSVFHQQRLRAFFVQNNSPLRIEKKKKRVACNSEICDDQTTKQQLIRTITTTTTTPQSNPPYK